MALCKMQILWAQDQYYCFCVMMSDMHRLFVLHFNMVSVRSTFFGVSKVTTFRVNWFRIQSKDGGRSAVSPTGPELVDLAPLGHQHESKLLGPEFVEIPDGHNGKWPPKWKSRVAAFKESSNKTLDLRLSKDVKFTAWRCSNARPDSKDRRRCFNGTIFATGNESCFPMRSCSSSKNIWTLKMIGYTQVPSKLYQST